MITVGLPVYNQTRVIHIALEGLCRQQKAGDWELVVSSENEDVWQVIESYKVKLKNAGCVGIVYDKLKAWIPLPQKWRRIGRLMNKKSLGMILQAADCYSHPLRIRQSKDAMTKGYSWYHESVGYFYYIEKKLLVKYDNSIHKIGTMTHLNMCISRNFAIRLPVSDLKSGIDGWMFKTIPMYARRIHQINNSHAGVDLHGMNNISKKRGQLIEDCTNAFKNARATIDEIGLPADIVLKIKELK